MKYTKFILIFLLSLFMTGCVSYSDLNELGIIDMVAIDKIDNEYVVSINMLLPNENDLENKKIYTSKNSSLNECLNDLYLSTTKKISFSHLELLILTPNLVKNDYDEIINLFLNRVDSRNTFNTVIVDTPAQIFNYKSKDINDLININSEQEGTVTIKQFDQIIKDILELGISYIPRIKIEEEIKIEGYQSIYYQNKLLSQEESIGYNFISNKITKLLFTVDEIGFITDQSLTNIKVDNNKITINIDTTYQITSNNNSIKNDSKIAKKYKDEIKRYINYYLDKNPHNYFYNLIKKHNYKYYNNNIRNINLEFDIKITATKIDNSNIKGGMFNE
ncbi:MAG: hypothetical protein IJO43_02570 [Bacilli bacterium]|nr:hypothetical protein [Bacilli bacterium]